MNTPNLTTQRLLLRKLVMKDLQDIYEFTSLPQITRFLTWEPHSNTNVTYQFLERAIRTYEDESVPSQWAIVDLKTNKLIGITGCSTLLPEHEKAELSFVLNPSFGRNGYMTEANRAVISYLFLTNINRVEAKAEVSNIASIKLLEACGLKQEGVFEDYLKIKGSYRTYKFFSVLKRNWLD